MTARPWRTALLVALATLLAVGTACGGDDDDSTADDSGSASASASANSDSGAWPVEIEHANGTTTIEERPERIVSLNVQWTDVLLAMDVEPTAYLIDEAAGEQARYPWQEGLLDGAEEIVNTGALPIEQIAALEPDLILTTYLSEEEGIYDSLSDIAPTIGMLGDLQVDPWQDLTEVAGRFLGEPEQAQAAIDVVETLVGDTATALPGLAGKTYLLVNYVPGDALYVVADTEDGASLFFQQLGLQILPSMLTVADGVSGRAELSLEQAGMLTSDLLVVLPNGGDLADLPGWTDLPAVTSGGVSEMRFEEVVGLNTPTPLSIPFALDLLRPALEAVAN